MVEQARGPLIIGIEGWELTANDRRRLLHPLVGGVILFARNYQDPDQLRQLTASIHALRTPALLIMVDQEGGRVQRFIEGFTRLPSLGYLGQRWDQSSEEALEAAQTVGWVLAGELAACGIDLSLMPGLDLNWGRSTIIGSRAFHHNPDVVVSLASALLEGVGRIGMASCGKHYPGHGYVVADSHIDLPEDNRSWQVISSKDLVPFSKLIKAQALTAILAAFVRYVKVDERPAAFSHVWLQTTLRNQLGFQGVVLSDGMDMAGAAVMGNWVQRCAAALEAGCDALLLCNDFAEIDTVLTELTVPSNPYLEKRLASLAGKVTAEEGCELMQTAAFKAAQSRVVTMFKEEQAGA